MEGIILKRWLHLFNSSSISQSSDTCTREQEPWQRCQYRMPHPKLSSRWKLGQPAREPSPLSPCCPASFAGSIGSQRLLLAWWTPYESLRYCHLSSSFYLGCSVLESCWESAHVLYFFLRVPLHSFKTLRSCSGCTTDRFSLFKYLPKGEIWMWEIKDMALLCNTSGKWKQHTKIKNMW